MNTAMRSFSIVITAGVMGLAAGCASERAFVSVGYVLEPSQGLPRGMKAVAVLDAKVNEADDQAWSARARDSIQGLILDARNRLGADIEVADRRDLGDIFEEDDLAAAGVTPAAATTGTGGQVMSIQGIIKTDIDVHTDVRQGKAQTIDGVDWGNSRHSGGGRIHTREIDTVSRNITVKTTFRLLDRTTNKDWITYSPTPYSHHDKTDGFFLLGSSQTEAELQPRDQIIGEAVNRGVREFIAQILPCEVRCELAVESSGNQDCRMGVQMLRADDYSGALRYFKAAMAADGNDHLATYGAGVAAEAAGNFEQALQYYRRACGMNAGKRYQEAKERLSRHLPHIRRTGTS